MRARRAGETPGLFARTSGTAETGTPARRAISRMVGRTPIDGRLHGDLTPSPLLGGEGLGVRSFCLDTTPTRGYRKPRTAREQEQEQTRPRDAAYRIDRTRPS